MKPELQEKVYTWVSSAAEKIGDWTSKEIPEFIKEYLTWKHYEAIFDAVSWFGVTTLIGVGAYFVIKLCKKRWKLWIENSGNADHEFLFWMSFIASGIFSAIVAIRIFAFFPYEPIKDIIQINVAPKVYLIEKASQIIKENKNGTN